jgi:hypothetical protein
VQKTSACAEVTLFTSTSPLHRFGLRRSLDMAYLPLLLHSHKAGHVARRMRHCAMRIANGISSRTYSNSSSSLLHNHHRIDSNGVLLEEEAGGGFGLLPTRRHCPLCRQRAWCPRSPGQSKLSDNLSTAHSADIHQDLELILLKARQLLAQYKEAVAAAESLALRQEGFRYVHKIFASHQLR